jgi:hypothetical protein
MHNMEHMDFGRLRWKRGDKIETDLTEIVYELDSSASLKIPIPAEVLVKESADFVLRKKRNFLSNLLLDSA